MSHLSGRHGLIDAQASFMMPTGLAVGGPEDSYVIKELMFFPLNTEKGMNCVASLRRTFSLALLFL